MGRFAFDSTWGTAAGLFVGLENSMRDRTIWCRRCPLPAMLLATEVSTDLARAASPPTLTPRFAGSVSVAWRQHGLYRLHAPHALRGLRGLSGLHGGVARFESSARSCRPHCRMSPEARPRDVRDDALK
eukprot:NODE_6283_length_517_cov_179.303030.p1 GENE.NODE_6283_length_517_cov_179.303030~~NODE_6283_length_517_cov_179.303030.p1  ORF type:complete len:129 (-),score=13.36 NODE_6283_length_517_cov_179.303030:9-395(-)